MKDLENRINSLEEKVDLLLKKLSVESAPTSGRETTTIKDLQDMYKKYDFEKFYRMCREYGEFIESDGRKSFSDWTDDCIDGETMFSRLVLCLSWFDVDKIASQIAAVNYCNDEKIASTDVENNRNSGEWRESLLKSLADVVRNIVKYGEATYDNTYIHYQSGRIHLESIYMRYEDRYANKLKLYFSDNDCEAYPDSWED